MDQIRYIVQPEGDKFVVYCEYRYDSGHNRLVHIDQFVVKAAAETFCEQLNKGGDHGY